MNIDEKVRELNKKDGRKFNKLLIKNLYDRSWCESHKIDYIDPDVKIAREKTYQEMFNNNKNISRDGNKFFKHNYLQDYIENARQKIL